MDLNQMVCMTKEEALRHENEVLKGGKKVEEVYDEIHVPPVTRSVPGDESQSVRQATDRTLPPVHFLHSAKGREKLYDTILAALLSLHERMIRQVTGQDTVVGR
jgi:hypothetical protein